MRKLEGNIIKVNSKFTLKDLSLLIKQTEKEIEDYKGELQPNGRIIYKKRK